MRAASGMNLPYYPKWLRGIRSDWLITDCLRSDFLVWDRPGTVTVPVVRSGCCPAQPNVEREAKTRYLDTVRSGGVHIVGSRDPWAQK